MEKMTLTDFEAIAAYDYKQNPVYGAVLLIEPLHSSVVLYAYGEKGAPTLLFDRILDNPAPVQNAIRDLGDWTAHTAAIKKGIQSYYKFGATTDVPIAGPECTASQLMHRYDGAAGNALENAFRGADAKLSAAGISEDKLRILLVGPMATFFPAEATARLHYSSAMPMILDVRYGTYPQIAEIIREGSEICAGLREKYVDGNVEWLLVQADGSGHPRTVSVTLAKDSTNVKDFSEPVFAPIPGVLITTGDTVNLTVCGHHSQWPVTAQFLEDRMGMINLGLQYENEGFVLVMQNLVSGKTQRFPMDIKVKGV